MSTQNRGRMVVYILSKYSYDFGIKLNRRSSVNSESCAYQVRMLHIG